jgi:hypothetical protein
MRSQRPFSYSQHKFFQNAVTMSPAQTNDMFLSLHAKSCLVTPSKSWLMVTEILKGSDVAWITETLRITGFEDCVHGPIFLNNNKKNFSENEHVSFFRWRNGDTYSVRPLERTTSITAQMYKNKIRSLPEDVDRHRLWNIKRCFTLKIKGEMVSIK